MINKEDIQHNILKTDDQQRRYATKHTPEQTTNKEDMQHNVLRTANLQGR